MLKIIKLKGTPPMNTEIVAGSLFSESVTSLPLTPPEPGQAENFNIIRSNGGKTSENCLHVLQPR